MDKLSKAARKSLKGTRVQISKRLIHLILISVLSVIIGGCSVMQSGAESLVEVPSLENQANRIITAMGLIRSNTIISEMPISADATWPKALNDEAHFKTNRRIIAAALSNDPYVATHEYTDLFQKTQLKGVILFAPPKISALSYNALNRVVILYGPNKEHWPTFFDIESDLAKLYTFEDGTLKQVEASRSNVYANVNDALIALMPVNFQKELHVANAQMRTAFSEVAGLKALKGEKETLIGGNNNPSRDENGVYPKRLSYREIAQIKQEILVLENSIMEEEEVAQEYESIYTHLLDEATEVLQSDIALDREHVALAKNIYEISRAIKQGALEAGAAFALTTTILARSNILKDFPKELVTLAVARAYIPRRKIKLYDKRIARLVKNAIYAVPALGIGSYYAIKQAFLAERYEKIVAIIIEADRLKND